MLCAEFADALSNPIAYQSELEKRAKQLAVLEDEAPNDMSDVNNQLNNVAQVSVCGVVHVPVGLEGT
jgi:hypothetical protein